MINIDEATRLINLNPEVDAEKFWTAIGVDIKAVTHLSLVGAVSMDVSKEAVLAAMEIGASLARPDIVEQLASQLDK